MKSEVGRNTILTDEKLGQIKKCIVDGKNIKETAEACEINELTFYAWTADNYLNISDKIEGWKRDRKLMLAERNIEEILLMDKEDKDKLKTVADISKFVSETLGKNTYSKRTETDITSQGEKIEGFNFISNDSKHKTDNKTGAGVEEVKRQHD